MLSIFATARRPLPALFATQSWISPLGSARQDASRPWRASWIGPRGVARHAVAGLEAAGDTVGPADAPIDDPLLAIAGTSVATILYQLSASHPELGEPSRRDAEALVAFVAHAEASRRVLLLVDEA